MSEGCQATKGWGVAGSSKPPLPGLRRIGYRSVNLLDSLLPIWEAEDASPGRERAEIRTAGIGI